MTSLDATSTALVSQEPPGRSFDEEQMAAASFLARYRPSAGLLARGEIGKQLDRVGAVTVERCKGFKRLLRCAARQQPEQFQNAAAVRKADHLADGVGANRASPHRDRLIENRQPVADGAFRGPRDDRQRVVLGGRPFLVHDGSKMTRQ